MAIVEVNGQPWSRYHDELGVPVVPSAPRTLYPQTLEDLIQICARRAPLERIHAAGSHWALSQAAISDNVFVETHGPANLQQALGRTLYDIVPPCLNPTLVDALASVEVPPFDGNNVGVDQGLYPIHIETGKRVYQLYAELDASDDDPNSLAELLATQRGNESYRGPWAFRTLGGAGGRTVFGALTTGTHGGDFRMPPIADSVLAIHLVADGGKHFWIEPASGVAGFETTLTLEDAVRTFYGADRFGGPSNFEYIRDTNLFDAVLVSAGRFGIVYSIVIAAVRQYSLHEERRLTTWSAIKNQIKRPLDEAPGLYVGPSGIPTPSRFLQVFVSVTPHANFSQHLAGVTKRWNVPMATRPGSVVPAGRPERRGPRGAFDARIQARRFTNAGTNFSYTPDPASPGTAADPSFIEQACADGNFLADVIDQVREEIQDFVDSNGEIIGPTLLAITAAGGGSFVLGLIAAFSVVLVLLVAIAAAIRASGDTRFGQVINDLRARLLNNPDPLARTAGLMTWQMIMYSVLSSQQEDRDYAAISYAVMDGHDYRDRSCLVHGDSIEVFFDATDPALIAYIDELLAFEIQQEVLFGKAFAGYISLRFTGPTRALIGPQRFARSCAVEVAGLRDVDGTTELIDFAIRLALDANFRGILHWGQRNESRRAHVEERFGDTPTDPTGPLHTWRAQLGRITDNGRLEGFSSAFTRRTGLEIVTPIITSLTATGSQTGIPIAIDWDCTHNLPATQATLDVVAPNGTPSTFPSEPLSGHRDFPTALEGIYTIKLVAALVVDGTRNEARQEILVSVTAVLS